jgi:hypothetical protein
MVRVRLAGVQRLGIGWNQNDEESTADCLAGAAVAALAARGDVAPGDTAEAEAALARLGNHETSGLLGILERQVGLRHGAAGCSGAFARR